MQKALSKFKAIKVLVQNGVRHEIDVFVTASLAAGYDATFIFECKNWNAKVGKNELIIFSEKVAVSGAQRGFYVAKAFTKDAQAQAKKDSRIKLLTASHFEPAPRVLFPQLHLLNITVTHSNVEIRGFNDEGALKEMHLGGKAIVINGTTQFEIVLGSVLSVYEVQSRGRVLIVGVSSHDIEMQAQLVEVAAPYA